MMERRVDTFERKGWCPSAMRPMLAGDGYLVRVRPRAGRLSATEAGLIAELSARYGNGAVDISSRGSLQLRGIDGGRLEALAEALFGADLAAADPAGEASRSIVTSPASDCDPSALIDAASIARRVETRLLLLAREVLPAAKFSVLIDDGGVFGLDSTYADIRLRAMKGPKAGPYFMLAVAGTASSATSIGIFDFDGAFEASCALVLAARRFGAHRPPVADVAAWLRAAGLAPSVAELPSARALPDLAAMRLVRLRPIFGRLEAPILGSLAAAVKGEEGAQIRLTTDRGLLVGPASPEGIDRLERLGASRGFIGDLDPELASVDACVGAPACAQALMEARETALDLAALLAPRLRAGVSLHVSGCAKGCARSGPSTIVVTGEPAGYRLGFEARAGEGTVSFPDLGALRAHLADGETTK